MNSDSIINASSSIPSVSKDFTKKKRANRSAKLKQCKLDARRQQWLSQADNKGPKMEGNGKGSAKGSGNREPTNEARKGKGKKKGKEPCCKGVEVRNVNVGEIPNQDSDSEESSMANSPTSSVNDSGSRYAASTSSSISNSSASSLSFGSGDCCSGSNTEDEEAHGGDNECSDDWETVADTLVANDKQGVKESQSLHKEARDDLDSDSVKQKLKNQNADVRAEKGKKSDSVGIPGRGGGNSKAWRSDDTCKPQSLPNLSKHQNLNPWACRTPYVPIPCPICFEDLDRTDSSFLPCPCGFHLCLFCHQRLIEGDARCPGCRTPYSSEAVEKETSLSGGSLTIRLARSCSMFSRG